MRLLVTVVTVLIVAVALFASMLALAVEVE